MYCTAVSEGGDIEWDIGWNQYLASGDSTHKDHLLRALACSKDETKISQCVSPNVHVDPQTHNISLNTPHLRPIHVLSIKKKINKKLCGSSKGNNSFLPQYRHFDSQTMDYLFF